MPIISIIAAIDENGGLGKNDKLLCHLPADLKHFKNLTMGKPIIMGRKTFLAIGKALPGRRNIVVTRQNIVYENTETAHSLEEALELSHNHQEIMIIGGGQIFNEALCKTERLYLTIIHNIFSADVFFPQMDMQQWEMLDSVFYKADDNNLYSMTFVNYVRIKDCSI